MKNSIYIFFLLITGVVFSQQTLVKSFSSDAQSIEILTEGLDEIKIINSNNDKIEVSLFDENPNSHHILVDDETSILKIKFKLEFIEEEGVFKKYITKRLNRASVIIKLPKNKDITLLGTNVDIISKSYKGNLNIFIDKGYINLHKVQQNVAIKLFQGNVFANVHNSDIDIQSTKGRILVNGKIYLKKYKKETENTTRIFTTYSINANITVTNL